MAEPLRVLPSGAYSPFARQGCAPRPANRAAGTRHGLPDSRSRWPPPSLRPDGPPDLAEPVRDDQSRPSIRLLATPPQTLRIVQWWPDGPAGRPPVYSRLALLGLSREHRPSSTGWDEVLAKDRLVIPASPRYLLIVSTGSPYSWLRQSTQ